VTALTEVECVLEFAQFLELQGEALRRPEVEEVARWAIEEAQQLISPALVYEWLAVEAQDERHIGVGGVRFDVGNHADLMAPAHEAFLCVLTIGPRLEERARGLGAAGRTLESYVLGEVGVFSVGMVGREAHQIAEEEAAGRGWGVGAEMAPGQLAGWNIIDQKLLCGLLDVGSIGIQVTDTGMLIPQKSVSMMVGIGPGYTSERVRSPCDYCTNQVTCRWRHHR
jgi:hypothetical protein